MPRLILENEFYWESREGRGAGEGIGGEGKDGLEVRIAVIKIIRLSKSTSNFINTNVGFDICECGSYLHPDIESSRGTSTA